MVRLSSRKKKKQPRWPITIFYDDREKKPWKLNSPKFKFVRKRLPCGDYTIAGMESGIRIERKSGWNEFLQNISSKNRKDFERKLINLSGYPNCYFVIEDVLENIPKVLKRTPTRMTLTSVCFWLSKITGEYGISLLLVGKDKRIRNEFLFNFFGALAEC